MTDLLTRIIGTTLGITTGWIIGTRLARRIPAIAAWWNEIAPWVDEPDPRKCDSDAVTAYLARSHP